MTTSDVQVTRGPEEFIAFKGANGVPFFTVYRAGKIEVNGAYGQLETAVRAYVDALFDAAKAEAEAPITPLGTEEGYYWLRTRDQHEAPAIAYHDITAGISTWAIGREPINIDAWDILEGPLLEPVV
jgi:hypothetical protein